MPTTITVAHSDFEKFKTVSIENQFSFDYLGYSDDGKYVRVYAFPSTILDITSNLIENHIKFTIW